MTKRAKIKSGSSKAVGIFFGKGENSSKAEKQKNAPVKKTDKPVLSKKDQITLWLPVELRKKLKHESIDMDKKFSELICYIADEYFKNKKGEN